LKDHPKLYMVQLGTVVNGQFTIRVNEAAVVDVPLSELNEAWATGLESQLRDEVLA